MMRKNSRSKQAVERREMRPMQEFPIELSEMVLPTFEEEARLLAAAWKIQELAPWGFLSESEMMGVANPETGGLGTVSVVGELGEMYGVIVYRDEEALLRIHTLARAAEDAEDEEEMESIALETLKVSQLQFLFTPKDELDPWDEEFIQRHNVPTEGRKMLPTFRSIWPGYLAWQIESHEARFLALALEQLIEELERPDFSPESLEVEVEDVPFPREARLFARVPDENGAWVGVIVKVGPVPPTRIELPDPSETLKKIASKPVDKEPLELDLERCPIPVLTDDRRPFIPEALLAGRAGVVLDTQLTTRGFTPAVIPDLMDMILGILKKLPKRPKELWVMEPHLSFLESFQDVMKIPVVWREELPTVGPAMRELLNSMEEEFLALLPEEDDDEMGLFGSEPGRRH